MRRFGLARAVALASLLLFGCQVIAGDFELAETPTEPPGDPCYPGEVRCNEGVLEACAASRHFVERENCGSPELCDPSAQACRPCTPNEYACEGVALNQCDATGQWLPGGPDCAAAELCSLSPGRMAGSCKPDICEEGELACSRSRLIRCAKERDHWELVEVCAEGYCNAENAMLRVSEGKLPQCDRSCADGIGDCKKECTPGTVNCEKESPFLLFCSANGAWVKREVCFTRALCDPVGRRCLTPACDRLETRCSGNKFETCSGDLTDFVTTKTCSSNEVCIPDEGCAAKLAEGECTGAERYRCNWRTVEECVDGSWQPRHVCATRSLCNTEAGVCDEPECTHGTYRCNPGSEICNDGRDGWEAAPTQPCGEAQVCTEYPDLYTGQLNACELPDPSEETR